MLKVDKLSDEIHKSWKYDDLLWRHKEIYADIQSFGYNMSRLYHSVRNVCRGSIVLTCSNKMVERPKAPDILNMSALQRGLRLNHTCHTRPLFFPVSARLPLIFSYRFMPYTNMCDSSLPWSFCHQRHQQLPFEVLQTPFGSQH